MLAMRQLDCEIGRLRSPKLIDVAPVADVKPNTLKDLLKVDGPDVRMSVDRARDALKTLTAVATVADAEKLLDAQNACEQAISGTVSSVGVNVMSTNGYANGQESCSPVEPPKEHPQLSVMVTAANTAVSGQSVSQLASQSQGGGQSKKPNQQNGKAKPKFQFAPNVGTGQISYQSKVRGLRWACPVKGHSGHTIAQCQDFWGAENYIEQRKLMAATGCFTCLGRDQGCGSGACAIVKEVPKDTICQEWAGYTNRTSTPPNILCCGLPFHKKPVVKDAMEVLERWIPDFKASGPRGTGRRELAASQPFAGVKP
jgi:hypothetical protein